MCHHYPGKKALTRDQKRALPFEFTQLKIKWWNDLPLASADCYPLREVAVIRLTENDTWLLENRTWGYLPRSWKPTAKVATANKFQRAKINARSETIDSTWPWKLAWRQRCLLPAEGFCEPHQHGGEGLYTLPDTPHFFIPGLWETYQGDDGKGNQIHVDSVVMLTCDANLLVAEHRTGRLRQPVVITDMDAATRYCSHEVTEHTQIAELLRPWPADLMTIQHVPATPKRVPDRQQKLF